MLCEEEEDPLEHLVTIQGRDCHVEEETVQDSFGNVSEDVLEECESDPCKTRVSQSYGCQDSVTNENVGEDVGQPGLPHVGHHAGGVAAGHAGLLVRQALHVEWGVRQHGVHEGKTEDGRDDVDDSNHHQVPVVGVALLEMVLGAVDHGSADVLVHEEQDGKREAEGSGEEDSADCELVEGH